MENKELKQAIPEELKDEQLSAVAGGNTMPEQPPYVIKPQPYVIQPSVIEPFRIDTPVKNLEIAKRENEVNIGL